MSEPTRAERLGTALGVVLSAHLGTEVSVVGMRRLTGGASRETWSFDAVGAADGADGDRRPMVLRLDPPGRGSQMSRAAEMAVLRAAHGAGVPVPEVVLGSDDSTALGSPFFVMARVEGEALPKKVLRDDEFAVARKGLVAECADALARVHTITTADVEGLAGPSTVAEQVSGLRAILSLFGESHPVFDLALDWLDDHLPADAEPRLVHGDFRTGNLLVAPDRLTAVLDWELAHWGDPLEDLGWLCVRSWRFGLDDLEAGGFGTRDDLLTAYEAATGAPVDRQRVRFWEVFGTLRWGITCVAQAAAHLTGQVRSVELAAIGRRACETEYDLLALIDPDGFAHARPALGGQPVVTGQDRPHMHEALEAVAELLETDVLPTLEGRTRYMTLVASRLLRVLEREARWGAQPEDGASLVDTAIRKLTIANPGHLRPEHRPHEEDAHARY